MSQNAILSVLHQFKESKQNDYRILRLGVFGSVDRNRMTEGSDVDVVVELDRPDLFVLALSKI